MVTLLITLKPKIDHTWPWTAELARPGDLLPLRYEGQLNLDLAPLSTFSSQREYGQHLGAALFQGDLRDALTSGLAASRHTPASQLRLQLSLEAPELRILHWERTLAPIDGRWEFLALNQSTSFSLYLTSRSDRSFPPLTGDHLRMLLAVASPQNLDEYGLHPFDVPATVDSINAALSGLPTVVIADQPQASTPPPTLEAIAQVFSEQRISLFHLVCHGRVVERTGETVLYLSTSDGRVAPLTGTAWIDRLARLKDLPHLVFLSTCESADPRAESGLGSLAQRMVRELGIPAVLAMTGKVSIHTAQAMAGPFYRRLAEHGEPDRALAEALVGLVDRPDFNVPALFTRLTTPQLFTPKSSASSTSIPQPIVPIKGKSYEPELVAIPTGSFLMGRQPAPGLPEIETPQTLIDLPSFLIGKYPITNTEYAEFIRQTRRTVPVELGWEGRAPATDQLKLPVRGVAFQEALEYCAWLSQQTGKSYTLPSEAQWEKAARGLDGRLYPWGAQWQPGRSNQGASRTAPVDAFPAQSVYGLHDLVGNVLQWTTTLWGEKRLAPDIIYPWQPDDGRDDPGANRQVRRVLRGSSFADPPEECICTVRRSFLPTDRGQPGRRHAFRVVCLP